MAPLGCRSMKSEKRESQEVVGGVGRVKYGTLLSHTHTHTQSWAAAVIEVHLSHHCRVNETHSTLLLILHTDYQVYYY